MVLCFANVVLLPLMGDMTTYADEKIVRIGKICLLQEKTKFK